LYQQKQPTNDKRQILIKPTTRIFSNRINRSHNLNNNMDEDIQDEAPDEASEVDVDETADEEEDQGDESGREAGVGSSESMITIQAVSNLDSLYGLREIGREALCWQLSSAKAGEWCRTDS
jgi:hypothetical protein